MLKLIVLALCLIPVMIGHSAEELFTVTAYCSCVKCCGRWSGGPTASGLAPRQGVTVAGPRRFALREWVWIEGVGRRQIQDRTAKRFDGRFDVYFSSHAEAVKFGKKRLKVRTIK